MPDAANLRKDPPVASSSRRALSTRAKSSVIWSCVAAMGVASVVAWQQPLRPDPRIPAKTGSALFWYPIETHPLSRLPRVNCDDEYACTLNAIAVAGSQAPGEVWAAGNVGLILHQKSPAKDWELVKIKVATPLLAPAARLAAATPTVRSQAADLVLVPDLRNLPEQSAHDIAAKSGLILDVSTAPPSRIPFVILEQKPAAGAKVPRGSTIHVYAGPPVSNRPQSSLLDFLELKVYAAEPQPLGSGSPGQSQSSLPPATQSSPRQQSQEPNKPGALNPAQQAARQSSPAAPSKAPAQPSPAQSTPTPVANQAQQQTGPSNVGEQQPSDARGTDQRRPGTSLGSATLPGVLSGRPRSVRPPVAPVRQAAPDLRDVSDDFLAIYCESPSACHIAAASGRIFETLDGGVTWSYYNLVSGSDLPAGTQSLGAAEFSAAAGPPPAVVFYAYPGSGPRPSTKGIRYGSSRETGQLVFVRKGLAQVSLPSSTAAESAIAKLPSQDFGTSARLHAIAKTGIFIWTAGTSGAILSSSDNGQTWQHETQGPEGGQTNRRFPAGWYWCLAALLLGVSYFVSSLPSPTPIEESVADWSVTDAPLRPGDLDVLEFTPMVLGLSRFIRNPKTQPPLTIAIEGKWGEGKSSVMNLLCGDLRKARFRPIWFNAWHHQSEEQLLAALLEHIKEQGLPPWWHPDNWTFRLRLIWRRFGRMWPLLVVFGVAFAWSAAYELPHILKNPTHLKDSLIHTLRDGRQAWSDFLHDSSPDNGSGKASASAPPRADKNEDPGHIDMGSLNLVLSLIGLIIVGYRQVRAFGIDPAKIADNLRDAAGIGELKPEPGIRRRFATEFSEVCDAWSWGGRRLIIFIDDLDRCRPESVVTVLESINFLTTAGNCIVVLGIAQENVRHCVGLSFHEIADAQALANGDTPALTEKQKADARYEYGRVYILKLVNITVRLPRTTPEQRKRILENREPAPGLGEAKTKSWRLELWELLAGLGERSGKFGPALLILLLLAISFRLGYQSGMDEQRREEALLQGNTTSGSSVTSDTAASTGTAAASSSAELVPVPLSRRQATRPGELVPGLNPQGMTWQTYLPETVIVLWLVLSIIYVLTARSNADAVNSAEFEAALALWNKPILSSCELPRELKRVLNDLRYQAMMRRNEGPSTTRGERLVLRVRQWITGGKEPALEGSSRIDEAFLPAVKAAELRNLDSDSMARFLDPAQLESQPYPAPEKHPVKDLIELKVEHITRFHRWNGQEASATAPHTASAAAVQ